MSEKKSVSVTQLVRRMRNLLEIELGELWVEGEVSNLRKQASGHYYFSLKDAKAQMTCAMFSARRRPGFECLEDGAKVRVFAEVTVYEARGQAQMIVQTVEPVGQGDLQARFEALKQKLHAEGLFDEANKMPLPWFPKKIGIVTSPTGAALQDMMNILGRRAPWLEVVLYPAQVQGEGAERGIARGIERLASAGVDTMIIGRGGGSLEDLWNFNEEIVARAISASPVPVISAVGHEIDFTIADFVADLRAPTPSAAAELVAPSRDELWQRMEHLSDLLDRRTRSRIDHWSEKLRQLSQYGLERDQVRLLREREQRMDLLEQELASSTQGYLEREERHLNDLEKRHKRSRPEVVIGRFEQKLEDLRQHMREKVANQWEKREARWQHIKELLNSLGPEAVLARGYSLSFAPDGRIIRSTSDVEIGEEIETRLSDGAIFSVLSSKEKPEGGVT